MIAQTQHHGSGIVASAKQILMSGAKSEAERGVLRCLFIEIVWGVRSQSSRRADSGFRYNPE